MKTLGNILWHFPFLGFVFAIAYALTGVFFCITIVGAPIGLGLFQFSRFLLTPFSNAMVKGSEVHKMKGTKQNAVWKTFSFIIRILYFPFGLVFAFFTVFPICFGFLSFFGIPSAMVWAKSFNTIFNPINKVCVPAVVGQELKDRKDREILEKYGAKQ